MKMYSKNQLKLITRSKWRSKAKNINSQSSLFRAKNIDTSDEATNALDKNSETKLFNNIFKYYPKLTVIVVTHRKLDLKFNKKVKIIRKGQNSFLLK